MAKPFLIEYPDGSKKHIGRVERDELLLGQLIALTSSNTYKYIGQERTYHNFSELTDLRACMARQQRLEPDFYPGSFIFEYKEKRYRERLESPEAFVLRLQSV